MWVYNKDLKKWTSKHDVISSESFEIYKQDLSSFLFYSKCLSGSTYIHINNIDNIYEVLNKKNDVDWYISIEGSVYSKTDIPFENPAPINIDNSDEFYIKNNSEYSLTLKNKFTPDKSIKEFVDNLIKVDVATIDTIDILNPPSSIDGVRLINNQKVLVKNQYTNIVLPISINPDDFFSSEFVIIQNFGSTVEYSFIDSTNGIYEFLENKLVKIDDIKAYEKTLNYSVYVELGDINKGKQFFLSRLKSGYYPIGDEPALFTEGKNWILRNRLDYNNVLDLNLYDVLAHGTQSYNIQGITYSIPERIIAVGEFGSIINNQTNISNIIDSQYKNNLRSITETTFYYWIVGDNGLVLRVRKHDFDIKKIKIKTINNLKSIDFFDNINGALVGDTNTIAITSDGGINWEIIDIESFDSYRFNKVLYVNTNKFYVSGNNGVFIEFTREISGWVAFKRRISRFEDIEDDYILVDDINDMIYTNFDNWSLDYSFSSEVTGVNKEVIIIVTNDNKIIIHDINGSIPFSTQFFYLSLDSNYGDIVNITRRSETNELYFTSTNGVFKLNISDFDKIGLNDPLSNSIISSSQIITDIFDKFTNNILDYEETLYIVGNNSLFKKSTYSNNMIFTEMDPDLENRLKSKMLFLDYDIASKLNFFTDDGEYRLPESVNIEYIDGDIEIKPLDGEKNWFSYWQDRQMTFEYSTTYSLSEETKVLISSYFSFDVNSSKQEISGVDVTNNLEDIINLAPNIDNQDISRYYATSSIQEPINNNYILYLYEYLMVYKVDTSYTVKKGDIIRLDCGLISSNFIVNKIVDFASNRYIYMFTDFNQNIVTDILKENPISLSNLNTFSSLIEFLENFNTHPISIGYLAEELQIVIPYPVIKISAIFNNLTAYYNMSASIEVFGHSIQEMRYKSSFLNFGYKPNYNLLDFLNRIDNNLDGEKEYLAMPIYENIPVVELEESTIIDSSKIYINLDNKNKIFFGEKLEFEWRSIFINTFINIYIDTGGVLSKTEKMLVNRKYKIKHKNGENLLVLELNNPLKNLTLDSGSTINIESRRKLSQISSDLQLLNNIQRPNREVSYVNQNYESDVSFDTFESNLNFRINTDSYAKILLSDLLTKRSITSIVYIDDKNELSMNISRVESNIKLDIINTGKSINDKLIIFCAEKHDLSIGDGVILEFTGPSGSSRDINNQYFGFRNVIEIINENNFIVDVDYGNIPQVGNDIGFVTILKRDPFLNYTPIDLIDVGVDKRGTIAIELTNSNVLSTSDGFSLVNVDFNKYRFRLVDGLNIEQLSNNYGWIYEAEISEAVIGLIDGELTWYKGIWECGRWFGGIWISGTWVSGDWYAGVWESKLIKDNWINIDVDDKSSNITSSKWLNGRWFGGTWNNGTWANGRWYSGSWNNGQWFNGIWNEGIWRNGSFTGGVWVSGDWNGGVFNTNSGPSYWLDGNWKSGDFENGNWYNGNFEGNSRFGTKSFNSRNANWYSGNWIGGSFYSRIKTNERGEYEVSDIHKYSIWRTGNWFSGDWYGGIAYNIDFKSGTWYGGIVEDIQIIGFNQTPESKNEIVINGLFRFNIGSVIFIIDNKNNTYPNIATNDNPGRFTVLNYKEDVEMNKTYIYVDSIINEELDDIDTGLKLVSIFRNCSWKSGVWNNGIYENGNWEGGIWYNGVFSANWM
jgi:hypothetical protein